MQQTRSLDGRQIDFDELMAMKVCAEHIQSFYERNGANNLDQKLAALEAELGTSTCYAYGGNETPEMGLAMLEFSLLIQDKVVIC